MSAPLDPLADHRDLIHRLDAALREWVELRAAHEAAVAKVRGEREKARRLWGTGPRPDAPPPPRG